ncbi:uncharacterized protein LOC130777327 [Actinidia eriantha]|uniref:uncharacterized protein LOC130777327 n=1 Tax=Actinidia eriantha TaxID=165200 RepID=UPI00258B8511|nr:uncharacterized protein LOC130777327 [Actinidia eriantha]
MARAGGITNVVNVGIAVLADWENWEFISHISLNVRHLFDFLLQFAAPLKDLQGLSHNASKGAILILDSVDKLISQFKVCLQHPFTFLQLGRLHTSLFGRKNS